MKQNKLYQELVESLKRPCMEEGDITVKQLALDAKIGEGKARRRLNEMNEEGVLEKHKVFVGNSWVDVYREPKKK